MTADGLEMTFATNHMSYFVLSNVLRERMGFGGRIVNTASDAHNGSHLDFEDLQSAKHYSGFGAYGRSKLCNILFTRELAGISPEPGSRPTACIRDSSQRGSEIRAEESCPSPFAPPRISR